MGKPADYRFNVSPVFPDKTQKVFELTASVGYLFDIDEMGNRVLIKDLTIGLEMKYCQPWLCMGFELCGWLCDDS